MPSLDERQLRRVEYLPQRDDGPTIRLVFTDEGARRFRELTRRHLHERIVFMIRGRVAMAPVIEFASTDDFTLITGNVTRKDAEALADAIPGPTR
jgi:preprotein translocase subunit SecD